MKSKWSRSAAPLLAPLLLIALLIAAPWCVVAPAAAQDDFSATDIFPDFSLGGFGADVDDPATWSARYSVNESGQGRIEVEVNLASGWHVYSMTQKPGGPLKTRLSLVAPAEVKTTSAFRPNKPPLKSISSIYNGLTLEEHDGVVVWSAPLSAPPGFGESIKVAVDAQVCKTDGPCMPVQEELTAQPSQAVALVFNQDDGQAEPDSAAKTKPAVKPFRDGEYVVQWIGTVTPKRVRPGDRGVIKFTAKPDASYHIYRSAIDDAESSTNFVVTNKGGFKIGAPETKMPVITKSLIEGLDPIHYHKGEVTWELPFEVPMDVADGEHVIEGMIGYQACTDSSCHRPTALKFTVTVEVAAAGEAESRAITMTSAKYSDAMDAAATTKWVDKISAPQTTVAPDPDADERASIRQNPDALAGPSRGGTDVDVRSTGVPGHRIVEDTPEEIAAMAKLYDADKKIKYLTYSDMDAHPIGSGGTSSSATTTFWSALFGAFVGGMLLNLMPCVFPVLGLKVMGFVKQSSSDPHKIRLHGIAFTLGLVLSMWILAGIILSIKLVLGQDINWGAQMGNPYFVCSMIVLLFVLGLNMAGVFEIGTSMTRVGGKLQGRKGYSSSFFSGVLTTLIATPCSGPFLGAAMSYTLAQTAGTAMFLFTVFALGIASPYLLLCFYPSLINKLPRPGVWMETFKVTMAFALFATVAYFMQTFGSQTGVSGLAWLAMALVVIGLAAYYYGVWSQPHVRRLKRWSCGYVIPSAIACLGIWMCFGAASQRAAPTSSYETGGLAWKAWNPGKVEYSLAKDKRPIWVDYTANWCPTCQLNKKRVFSNSDVVDKLQELNVELVRVDDTLREERIARDLKRADRSIIPVNLIYPANYPEEPAILLEALISPADALKVLARIQKIQEQSPTRHLSMAQ